MKYLLPLFFLLLDARLARSQTKTIDSLRYRMYNTTDKGQRLMTLLSLLNEYESLSTDSFVHYFNLADSLSSPNIPGETALELNTAKIRILRRQNKLEEAIALCDSCYKIYADKRVDPTIYRRFNTVRSGLFVVRQQYKEAIDLNFNTLKKAELAGDEITQVYCEISIGWINMEIGKNREALSWFFNAIDHAEKLKYTEKLGTVYANMAAIYEELKIRDSAEYFINKAFQYAIPNDNLTVLANCYYIFSDIMVDKKNIPAAEDAMNKGLAIRKKIADPFFYVSDLYQLAIFYAKNKQPQKGVETSLQAIEYAEQNNLKGKYLILFEALALNYKAAGNDKMYSAALEKIIALKDSVYKNNSPDAMGDLQTKYEVQKKETLIARQKLDLFQRNLLLYGGASLALLVLAFLFYRFKKYQRQEKINLSLLLAAEGKKKKIAVRDAEEQERKRIAAELHDNLGVQATAILHNSNLLLQENNNRQMIAADLQETAKEMMLNLRETLWALKTTDVDAIEVWLRIVNFMKQMGRHYTNIHFNIEGDVPEEFIVSSSKALNIILLVQEAVNNSVKHARAQTISAVSIFRNNNWDLLIKDDGSGFNSEKIKDKGDNYGLQNMAERAEAGNFKYVLTSKENEGTVILLSIGQ